MTTVWMLIWFAVIPEVAVRYHHLDTFDNETLCKAELKVASVMVNNARETIECIGVTIND
tara:strand:+ start:357 stop:536 length:180 start_codon:yes stop_codon:yes gene_type:complete